MLLGVEDLWPGRISVVTRINECVHHISAEEKKTVWTNNLRYQRDIQRKWVRTTRTCWSALCHVIIGDNITKTHVANKQHEFFDLKFILQGEYHREAYTRSPSPRRRSSLSCFSLSHPLRSFGFWRVRPPILVSSSPRPYTYRVNLQCIILQ